MASTHILAIGKIVRDGIEMDISMPPWLDPHEAIELPPLQEFIDANDDDDEPWPLQANERMGHTPPLTRDQRAEEAAALYDNARYYEWCKREREDYEEDMADRDFWGHHC